MGIPIISIAKKKSLVHDSGVCDERALLIVSLRALALLWKFVRSYVKCICQAHQILKANTSDVNCEVITYRFSYLLIDQL